MRQESPASPPSHVDLLRRAADGVSARLAEILRGADLTLDQWRVLQTLDGHGPLSMSELGARTRITGPTATRLVDGLVERSLLYRNVDATDRRRVLVHTGDRGRALCRSLDPQIAAAERGALSALSEDETRMLRRLLERLTTA